MLQRTTASNPPPVPGSRLRALIEDAALSVDDLATPTAAIDVTACSGPRDERDVCPLVWTAPARSGRATSSSRRSTGCGRHRFAPPRPRRPPPWSTPPTSPRPIRQNGTTTTSTPRSNASGRPTAQSSSDSRHSRVGHDRPANRPTHLRHSLPPASVSTFVRGAHNNTGLRPAELLPL